jgi:transcriptional regulator NrdR family protein
MTWNGTFGKSVKKKFLPTKSASGSWPNLHELNDIAYVRFASVYREFKDVNDFVSGAETPAESANQIDRRPRMT